MKSIRAILLGLCIALLSASSLSVQGVALVDKKPRYLGELMEETGFYQALRLSKEEPLVKQKSKYQEIEVHQSRHYGKILVLDGVLQLTEKDADAYNEMMAHLPMFQHPNPRRVLVIGGGDGYVVSEVLKHESVEHVDHVDLDEQVIEVCKKHFSWGAVWKDPRVHLHIADGAAFVKNAPANSYDVVIQDSSDPWTWDDHGNVIELPSSALYTEEHMANVYRVLSPEGILNLQAETLQIPSDLEGIVSWRQKALKAGFSTSRYSSLIVSTYPTGQIGCLLCEKAPSLRSRGRLIEERYLRMCDAGRHTNYYHPRLQKSSFDLPLWAEKRIYGEVPGVSPKCRPGEDPGQQETE